MRKIYIGVSCLLLPLIASGAVYRWVDRNGVPHFTDTQRPGATKIRVRDVPTYQPVAIPKSVHTSKPSTRKGNSDRYDEMNIVSPQPETTIRNNQGMLPVHIQLTPSLDSNNGDTINVYLDGKLVGQDIKVASFTLSGIYRGAHHLTAEVIDKNDKMLIRSADVKFFMHRPTDKAKRKVPLGDVTPPQSKLTPADLLKAVIAQVVP